MGNDEADANADSVANVDLIDYLWSDTYMLTNWELIRAQNWRDFWSKFSRLLEILKFNYLQSN